MEQMTDKSLWYIEGNKSQGSGSNDTSSGQDTIVEDGTHDRIIIVGVSWRVTPTTGKVVVQETDKTMYRTGGPGSFLVFIDDLKD